MAEASRGGYLARPAPSGLADVIDLILDKGLVVDAYVRVNLVGIELLTIDARVVISSVDTYLRFAEATNRLDLDAAGPPSLLEAATESAENVIEHVAETVVEHKVEAVKDDVEEKVEAVKDKVTDTVHSVEETVEDVAENVAERVTGRDRRG